MSSRFDLGDTLTMSALIPFNTQSSTNTLKTSHMVWKSDSARETDRQSGGQTGEETAVQ